MSKKNKIKYKLLSVDELIINLDRLTRFKHPEDSFNRVFSSIALKYLIFPKYSKKDIEELDIKYLSNIVKEIWNQSVKNISITEEINYIPNKIIKLNIKNTFKNIDIKTKILINTKLNISPILSKIDVEKSSINLKFLALAYKKFLKNEDISIESIINLREKYSLLFPIEKLIIVEGITEEILLPSFANKIKKDFKKRGIFILGAGGKSKSPALYLELKNKLKIPTILLFDADAKEISDKMHNILNKKDKIILIEKGEFEDIIPINLIKRSLNKEYEPITKLTLKDLLITEKMCDNIENFYRTRHLGEYKKSKVSKLIEKNIKYQSDISKEINEILDII